MKNRLNKLSPKMLHPFSILITTAVLLSITTAYLQRDQLYLQALKMDSTPITVVLDPGHGGQDPGKIGVDNSKEKDINLAIAKLCKEQLTDAGIQVILTRNQDESLCSPAATNKKAEDMKCRREIIEKSSAVLAVSIHQNSFSDMEVFGAQTFYYTNSEKGKELASFLQEALKDCNPDNHRTYKSNSEYYILKSGSCPTVICECGFLSNPEECAKLNSSDYQNEVAKAITRGILSYLYNQKGQP